MVADVIVDVRARALDRSFSYRVPSRLIDRVRLGTIVRVKLHGRRVRGWVVGLGRDDAGRELSEVESVSGPAPVFDEALLGVARRLAARGVQPLSALLARFTPPLMGRGLKPEPGAPRVGQSSLPLPARPLMIREGPGVDPAEIYREEIGTSIERGGGAIVVTPDLGEESLLLGRLERHFPGQIAMVHSRKGEAERSRALWRVAMGERPLVLGGRAAVFTPPLPPGGPIIVHREHDPGLKEQRSPYYDARIAARLRAEATGSRLILSSATPSLMSLSWIDSGWEVREPARAAERRAWPVVEVVPPERGRVPRRAIAALIEAHRQRSPSVVLLPREAPTRTRPGLEQVAAFVERVIPAAVVTRLGERAGPDDWGDVVVATETVLAESERPSFTTAVALDVDSYLLRPRGQAPERAFEKLWSLGSLVSGVSPKGRLVLETEFTDHHVVQAITRGSYRFFSDRELAARREGGWPPFATLIRLRGRGREPDPGLMSRLHALPGCEVLGPAEDPEGWEILLKTPEIDEIAGSLYEAAAAAEGILIEVDPRDW